METFIMQKTYNKRLLAGNWEVCHMNTIYKYYFLAMASEHKWKHVKYSSAKFQSQFVLISSAPHPPKHLLKARKEKAYISIWSKQQVILVMVLLSRPFCFETAILKLLVLPQTNSVWSTDDLLSSVLYQRLKHILEEEERVRKRDCI